MVKARRRPGLPIGGLAKAGAGAGAGTPSEGDRSGTGEAVRGELVNGGAEPEASGEAEAAAGASACDC